jgi:hypothetical protein
LHSRGVSGALEGCDTCSKKREWAVLQPPSTIVTTNARLGRGKHAKTREETRRRGCFTTLIEPQSQEGEEKKKKKKKRK